MIKTCSLTKKFGHLTAADNISFEAESGEVLAFLGPNGAGKSTTMRMITGCIYPTSGTVKILGKDIVAESTEAKRHIGYLPESAPCYKDIKVDEFLTLIAGIRGIPSNQIKEKVDAAIHQAFLEDVKHRIIDTLSKGYKQRVCFAQAIIHNPPVLILDEPTDGLDPNQKNEMRNLIRKISKDKTIILSTHILEEMEAVCNRAMIINKGKMILDTTPAKLAEHSPKHNAITFKFKDGADMSVFESVNNVEGVESVQIDRDGRMVEITSKNRTDISGDVLRFFNSVDFVPEAFHAHSGRIDEVFNKLTLNAQ